MISSTFAADASQWWYDKSHTVRICGRPLLIIAGVHVCYSEVFAEKIHEVVVG